MKAMPKGPRLQINVTKEAITKAIAADSSKCWIAESIKAAVPDATAVAVDLATTRFSDLKRGLRYVYLTPYRAQLALLNFDEGTPPPPFAFVLKNAHVTRAGTSPGRQAKRNAAAVTVKGKQEAVRDQQLDQALKNSTIRETHHRGLPRRVGGRRPPQLRMLRAFGIRAFRGASQARIIADAAIVARAEAETERP